MAVWASISCWEVRHVAPGEFRLRIAYAKTHRLAYLSHLEVVHALERGARRADLPYAVTRGFNPHMKVAFGPALPVGTAGLREYLDVWLTRYVPADEVVARLKGAMVRDLMPLDAAYIPNSLSSLSAACTIAVYEVRIDSQEVAEDTVRMALDEVVRSGELSVEHKGKTKVYDLASSLPKEPHVTSEGDDVVVALTIRMGAQGSLRPEALLSAALERTGSLSADMAVTRVETLVEDEKGFSRPI